MGSSNEENSIYDIRMSTVAPGVISGHNAVQELSAMDLAMKLHYLRFVYYFPTPAFDGFTILKIKETMFNWLNHAYVPCGRLRRADSGRPYIKCNDSGVRIIEAKCHLSLDEWLESRDHPRYKLLVPNQVIGPELAFSPLVLMQLTTFKCGGTSVGMSWAHVLGDAFSAVGFIRLWTQVMANQYPAQPLTKAQPQVQFQNSKSPDPLSIKRIDPVEDLWTTSNDSKMETFSFHISSSELTRLQAKIHNEKADRLISSFECICVVIWQCVAKVSQGSSPEIVTLCKNDFKKQMEGIITNKSQTISVVKTDVPVAECSPMELGLLIMDQAVDEQMKIEEAIERDDKLPDFLIYGVNLTFVDWSDVPFYDMEVRGQKPVYGNFTIDDVGGSIITVVPTPSDSSDGKIVSITLPDNQMVNLRSMLKEDWAIA